MLSLYGLTWVVAVWMRLTAGERRAVSAGRAMVGVTVGGREERGCGGWVAWNW